jgi:DNA endonuclease
MTYSEIAASLRKQYNVGPSKGQLSEWLRGIHGPFGSANGFQAEPTPELAYVIGVTLGDGSLNIKGYNRRIRLQSIDLDFVLEFDRCLSNVLGTRKHKPWFDSKRREIHVEARSVLLHGFLNQNWKRLKPWTSHCNACTSKFLRGFFDSEGCVSVDGDLTASNSDFGLLQYVRNLLKGHFNVDTTGPHLTTRKGSILRHRGKKYVRKADCFEIYVRRASQRTFYRRVGFAIERKRVRLERRLGVR